MVWLRFPFLRLNFQQTMHQVYTVWDPLIPAFSPTAPVPLA